MYRGQLTKWDNSKGFGFIKTPELKSNTFIHISTLKHMNRKPKQGDYIHFDIEQHNGKYRAINSRIEGVKTIAVYEGSKNHKTRSSNKLIYGIMLIGITVFIFQRINLRKINQTSDTQLSPELFIPDPTKVIQTHSFTCDGRQHCSQMRSRAEAEYFNNHCPNTKMDGDSDGIPCENDSRF